MNYRKLVTSFYNGYPKSMVYYRKNHWKKVSPHENPKENFLHWNLKRKNFPPRSFPRRISSGGLFGHRYISGNGLIVLGGWIIWQNS